LALKKELLVRIAQLDDDETIRKKICYIAAELARNLMGIKIQNYFINLIKKTKYFSFILDN
jgi:hypothetical protein